MTEFERALNYLRDAVRVGLPSEEIARRAIMLIRARSND